MSKTRLRRAWLKTHLFLGLFAGLLFVLLGLTGSVLVFHRDIDEWLNPELLLTQGTGSRRSAQEIITAAERAFPGESRAESAIPPKTPDGNWMVWFQSGTKESPTWTHVCVDPYTAETTGQRIWGKYLTSWIYELHYKLQAGLTGATIVGIAGILLMISVGSGLYLWWPLWKNGWRAAFAIRGGARFNHDLHKLTGLASSLILFVIAFTGVYMTFPSWFKPVMTVFSEETKPPEDLHSAPTSGGAPLTPEQAIAIARGEFPDATFDHFHPPQGPDGVYEVVLRQPGEVNRSFGRTQVWVDQHTGRILALRDPGDFTAADTFSAWQFPLHNGEAFGLIGRWVVLFAGLVPTVLYVTGFLLWWRKRRSRAKQRGRHQAHSLATSSNREVSAPAPPSRESTAAMTVGGQPSPESG